MHAGAAAYGNQFPAYREDPLRAVEGLAADPGYARQYAEFQRLMVSGDVGGYAACIGTLRELSDLLPRDFGGGSGAAR